MYLTENTCRFYALTSAQDLASSSPHCLGTEHSTSSSVHACSQGPRPRALSSPLIMARGQVRCQCLCVTVPSQCLTVPSQALSIDGIRPPLSPPPPPTPYPIFATTQIAFGSGWAAQSQRRRWGQFDGALHVYMTHEMVLGVERGREGEREERRSSCSGNPAPSRTDERRAALWTAERDAADPRPRPGGHQRGRAA